MTWWQMIRVLSMAAATLLVDCGGNVTSTGSGAGLGGDAEPGVGGSSAGTGGSFATGGAAGATTGTGGATTGSGGTEAGVGGRAPVGLEGHCSLDSDCMAPLVCSYGACHTVCESSKDCPAPQRCIQSGTSWNVCQFPSEAACAYGSDCASPLVCAIDGVCRNQCATDRDCVSSQSCASAHVCADPAELDPAGNLPGTPALDAGPP